LATETTEAPIAITDAVWEAIEGDYDLQVHHAPGVIARPIGDLDLAKEFAARRNQSASGLNAQKVFDAGFHPAEVRRMAVTNPTALVS
jgi:hypothetical protein